MQLLGECQDILLVRQPPSQPAAIGQPTSHVTRYQPVKLWVGQIFGGRRTCYIPLALCLETVCSFVSIVPNHIFAHNVEKCYMDYVLSRLIYRYPSTINLMYYYTKVLLLRNLLLSSEMLRKKSEKGTSEQVSLTQRVTKCQDNLM